VSDRPEPTRIVCGIDEAGLGPLLGPLTFGYSAFRIPAAGGDLWTRLEGEVVRSAREGADRIVVADSKKVYARNPRGRQRLETTALTFLAQRSEGRLTCGADLLRTPPPKLRPRAADIDSHPWYARLAAELPIWMPADRLAIRAARLRRALDASQIELLTAGVRVVPELELNRSFEQTDNKSISVMAIVLGILGQFWETYGAEGVRVVVDRQGGRWRYARVLQGAFADVRLSIVYESPQMSRYLLEDPTSDQRMLVTFAERGEERAFTVALASCIAKYTRELCMEAFNAFFSDLQPDLQPTAGYTTDGRRWVEEAAPALAAARLAERTLIRER
jgi:hypothetical protein